MQFNLPANKDLLHKRQHGNTVKLSAANKGAFLLCVSYNRALIAAGQYLCFPLPF